MREKEGGKERRDNREKAEKQAGRGASTKRIKLTKKQQDNRASRHGSKFTWKVEGDKARKKGK